MHFHPSLRENKKPLEESAFNFPQTNFLSSFSDFDIRGLDRILPPNSHLVELILVDRVIGNISPPRTSVNAERWWREREGRRDGGRDWEREIGEEAQGVRVGVGKGVRVRLWAWVGVGVRERERDEELYDFIEISTGLAIELLFFSQMRVTVTWFADIWVDNVELP